MRKAKGFSLIELLIVVAIILIIAAIAIPNLVKSKMAANEAAAVGSVRTVVTSELTYASIYPSTGFTSLANLYSAGLIDSVLGGGNKSGYSFASAPGSGTPAGTFTANANPVTVGTTGTNYYCSDQTGVIQRNTSSFGTSTNPCTGGTPIGQ
jgi:prepilin-type N-terminal cleavage/methylation domain-containing protein